ncbi:MAG: ABC transporter substrate-binding protein, partial [Bdellovibrionales bacterium]|nr:ABC transporter substrate-binding protein [Bdellovibrionales bacterium]
TLLFSCTKKKDINSKILNLAVTAEIKGMDPIYASDVYSGNEIARVYEGLYEYHYLKRPYTLVPNLAESQPEVSQDGLTYKIKIKKGVMFHDDAAFPNGKGRELVASDFVYSIMRLADPKLQGLGWWVLQGKVEGLDDWREKYSKTDKVDYNDKIEGLQALDKYTIQFKLVKPFPQFLYSLAMPFTYVVAREVVEKYGKEFINHPVGTGPFILPEFKQSNKIVYKKNPNYRKVFFPKEASEEFENYLVDAGKQLPLVDEIIVNIMKEEQPRWLSFSKGKLDYISIPKDNFESVITPDKGLVDDFQKKGVSLIRSTGLDLAYIAFNHDLDLFKNVKLRRALSLAYNPQASNKLFYNDTATPAQSIVPPGIAGHIPGLMNPYMGQNIEKAKELLSEAGYPNGKGLPEITYDCPANTTSRQMGEFFKKQMALIGVNVKVVTNPWPQLQAKINNRQVMLFGIGWGADYPDAENFLQLLYGPNKSPGANGSGYDNPIFNRLYKSASTLQDSPERTALYEKMNRMAMEEVPVIFGMHRQNFILHNGWLKNYIASDFDWGHAKYLNVDINKKKELLKKL